MLEKQLQRFDNLLIDNKVKRILRQDYDKMDKLMRIVMIAISFKDLEAST